MSDKEAEAHRRQCEARHWLQQGRHQVGEPPAADDHRQARRQGGTGSARRDAAAMEGPP